MAQKAPKAAPDFSQLRYFRASGSLGFGVELWAEYFSAPLYADMYKRHGILRDEFAVLGSLYDCGSLSAKTICAITGRPKNSISRGVNRLIAAGRIKRVTNPDDRREAVLSLLAEGRRIYEKILPLCREREQALMTGLSQADLLSIDTLMMKLLVLYHQTPEGMGLDRLRELGIPVELHPSDLEFAKR